MNANISQTNYLAEYNQGELCAYRKLGSITRLKQLRRKEIRRLKRLNSIKQVLKYMLIGFSVAIHTWLIASWIDILLHMNGPNPVYQAWNAFLLLF